MLTSPHPPSCCASLRQTLLNGWNSDFPIHTSPFRQMAARSGAKPRELLSICQSLQQSGSLLPVQARWGTRMKRGLWRLAFDARSPSQDLIAALYSVPGCLRIEQTEPTQGMPSIWAEVEALDEDSLQGQLARLPIAPMSMLQLPSPCAADAMLCDDPELAAALERGLPFGSRPFAACAASLGRSEFKLLSALQTWRRAEQLDGLALKPPPSRSPSTGLLALWGTSALPEPRLNAIRSHAAVERLVLADCSALWPWRLSLVLRTTSGLAFGLLRDILVSTGLPGPDASSRLRIYCPREQGMLFNVATND